MPDLSLAAHASDRRFPTLLSEIRPEKQPVLQLIYTAHHVFVPFGPEDQALVDRLAPTDPESLSSVLRACSDARIAVMLRTDLPRLED